MKREETWNKRLSSIEKYVTRNNRCPSKYHAQERAMYEWIKYNKRLLRRQGLKTERIKPFQNLLDVISKYQRLNQYRSDVPDNLKLLLLGSGGREHALAWKIAQSPSLSKLYIAPGNAGTAALGENVPLKVDDFSGIKEFVLKEGVNMVVVGPEDPLVKGIYDFFKNDTDLKDIPLIGPSREGAMLEGSKDFAKGFMKRHGIPTASYQTFTSETLEQGKAFLRTLQPPYVLKADGLCAGKGVLRLLRVPEEAGRFPCRACLPGGIHVPVQLGRSDTRRTGA